ncbi:MAG: alpha/beta hydrolase [Polyangia bacterium]
MKRLLFCALLCAGCQPASLDSFLYAPLAAPPGGYQLSTAVIPSWQSLTISTSDGEKLDAIFIPGAGSRSDVTLIYFHGQDTNIGTAWQRIEYLYPLGYNLFVFDYRGFGKSTGTPSEPGIRLDEEAIRAALVVMTGVNPQKLIYYGRSFGGAPCIDLASIANPAVLMTESPFTSVQALVADGADFDLPVGFVARSRWDNLAKIPHVPSPYLALHGAADDYVQPKYSVELTQAHPGVTRLELVPGADHSDVPETMGLDAYRQTLSDFVDAALPP